MTQLKYLGQGKIWGGGGHFKESAPEISIENSLESADEYKCRQASKRTRKHDRNKKKCVFSNFGNRQHRTEIF